VNQGSSFNREEAMGEDCKLKELEDPADCFNRLPLARTGSILRRTFCFSLVAALLMVTAHRLPAPIQEVPESPAPAPEQSAKPKPKRTVKPKASESSESSTKARTPSPTLKNQPTPNRNAFDGEWSGHGNVADYTLVISARGTAVYETSTKWGTYTWTATCDGVSMRWNTVVSCGWIFTPNPDGKTAIVVGTCSGILGIGAGNWSGVFRRTSP
jgi:hypothetical protein